MSNRKEEILIVALHLFARDGYEAVSVSQIAGELDMTKGALYRHYKSKRDIFDCIVQRMEQQDGEQASEYDMPEEEKEKMPEQYENVSLDDLVEYSKSMYEYWTEDDFVKYNIMKENIDFYGKSGFRQASEYGIRYHGLPEGYLVDEQEVEEFDRQLMMCFSVFK